MDPSIGLLYNPYHNWVGSHPLKIPQPTPGALSSLHLLRLHGDAVHDLGATLHTTRLDHIACLAGRQPDTGHQTPCPTMAPPTHEKPNMEIRNLDLPCEPTHQASQLPSIFRAFV